MTKRIRPPFDAGNCFAPILISPIVFIPLLRAFQNANADLADPTLPKRMIFLVTFENGIFCKELVDNRQREQKHSGARCAGGKLRSLGCLILSDASLRE
jgi:hypothetical protein